MVNGCAHRELRVTSVPSVTKAFQLWK